jgi:hypothetical protein
MYTCGHAPLPLLNDRPRSHPWSTYAVHLTTLSHWALFGDCLLVFLYFQATRSWEDDSRTLGFVMLACWMFASKFVKLMGHYIRYPADFLLLPVSITFGYLHGLIKVYAMLSLNVVR